VLYSAAVLPGIPTAHHPRAPHVRRFGFGAAEKAVATRFKVPRTRLQVLRHLLRGGKLKFLRFRTLFFN
jgi:hypothetical protein